MFRYILKISAAVFLIGAIIPLVLLWPTPGKQVAIILPPWTDPQTFAPKIWEAGGYILDINDKSIVAIGENNRFFMKLLENGAVLILDAEAVAALCGTDAAWGRDQYNDA